MVRTLGGVGSRAASLVILCGLGAAACGSSDSGGDAPGSGATGTQSMFVVPATLDALADDTFFDHPWPSDARTDADGTPHWKGYPNPRQLPIIADYIKTVDPLVSGFSPAASGFVRFTGSIDEKTLPADPGASILATASAQLVDVDPASPEVGKRRLVSLYWRNDPGVYWPEHTLSFMPTFGYPLRPGTRYAFVVTDAVKDATGAAITPSDDLKAVLGLGPLGDLTHPVHDAWAPSIAQLGKAGIAPEHIVHLTVFETSDPTAELFAVRDDVRATFPAPTFDAAKWAVKDASAGVYQIYEGEYGPSPNYQHGTIPFTNFGDGGEFQLSGGKPALVDQFSLRFALAVPDQAKCPMPTDGYPIVLYAHGTGGNYRSWIHDGTAAALANVCLASMGIDQIFHGTRPGAPPLGDPNAVQTEELTFFNFQNPVAARTNGREAAIDEVQRARLFTESHDVIPATVAVGGAAVKFDPARVMFFGHSQGGLNGPLFLAIDDGALGGVLSGSGSMISISLLEKTKPQPSVASAVRNLFLGLKPLEYEELNSFHPEISLAQSIVDVLDPIHYVGHLATSPRTGMKPKSIYQTEGVNADFTGDSYTPPHSIEVQSVATGLPPQSPVIHTIAEDQWSQVQPVTIPAGGLSGNLAGGQASGVLAQWPAAQASDGHFVVFDIPAAQKQAAQFCRNLADDPKGKVPAP